MKTKRLLITLNGELYHQLQNLADLNGLSMAAQVRYFISQSRFPVAPEKLVDFLNTRETKVTIDDQ